VFGRGPTARDTGDAQADQGGVANSGIVQGDITTYTIHAGQPVGWPVWVGVVPPEADCYQPRVVTRRLSAITSSGRTAVLCQILSGLGGVGKTQLAAAHARQLWQAGALGLLVWVSAASRSAIVAGYAQAHAAVTGMEVPDAEQAASRLLAGLASTERSWLIVLDDLTEPGDLLGLWPPNVAGGRTMVTTRRRDAALPARAVVALQEQELGLQRQQFHAAQEATWRCSCSTRWRASRRSLSTNSLGPRTTRSFFSTAIRFTIWRTRVTLRSISARSSVALGSASGAPARDEGSPDLDRHPLQIDVPGNTELRPCQPVRLSQIEAGEVGHSEVGCAEVCPAEVRPLQLSRAEVRPFQVRPVEIRPSQVRVLEERPLQARKAEVRSLQVYFAETRRGGRSHRSRDQRQPDRSWDRVQH
jgi:hypothetical protein